MYPSNTTLKGLQDESLPANKINSYMGVRAVSTADRMMPQLLLSTDSATDKTIGISCDVAVPVAGTEADLVNFVVQGRTKLRIAASVPAFAIGQSFRCTGGFGVLAATGQSAIAYALHSGIGGELVEVFVARHTA